MTVRIEVATSPEIEPDRFGATYVDRWVRQYCDLAFEGDLVVRRRIERGLAGGKGRVSAFRFTLHGTLAPRGAGPLDDRHELTFGEEWTLDRVREGRDTEFRVGVLNAIEKGCDFLRKSLQNPEGGNIGPEQEGSNRTYQSGRLALALLALIKAGGLKDDPVVRAGLDSLRKRTLVDTYSLGNALMALEAAYAPANEEQDLINGLIRRQRGRSPTEEDLRIMERWVEALLANADTRVDDNYLLRFNYVAGARFDNSVNQYGLLGLYSAHLCGVKVSPSLWEAAGNHLIRTQGPEGPRMSLRLTDYREWAKMEADSGRTGTASTYGVGPAGWNYIWPSGGGSASPQYGSMTCASLTGLAICQAAFQDLGLERAKLFSESDVSRAKGFAWLAENLDTRHHPGWVGHETRWVYYYLYGLERAAVLNGVALIQGRDWYHEGSQMLIGLQNPDGSWPAEYSGDNAVERAAMAVLFLKKASVPVLSGER